MLTANGRVAVLRTRWHAPGAGGDTPADRLLDAAEATVSLGVRELCCLVAVDGRGFDRAAQTLLKAAQLGVSGESLRAVAEAEGKAVLGACERDELDPGWCASQCQTKAPDGRPVTRVYATADGVKVPVTTQAEKDKRRATVLRRRRERGRRPRGARRPRLGAVKRGADQRYKQFNVVAFYDQGRSRRLVSVTRKDCRGAEKLLRRDAARIRLRAAAERVGLVDGAVCLKKQMDGLGLTAVGLDFWHLGDHVHEAKRSTFGDAASADGDEWAGAVLHAVRHGGYDPFWAELVEWRGRQRAKARRAAADDLLHYVSERRDMIDYGRFEKNGWDVGTGPVESMCKVTTWRLKGPGMRWDADNAEAVAALECLRQSNLWDQYWRNATAAHANN